MDNGDKYMKQIFHQIPRLVTENLTKARINELKYNLKTASQGTNGFNRKKKYPRGKLSRANQKKLVEQRSVGTDNISSKDDDEPFKLVTSSSPVPAPILYPHQREYNPVTNTEKQSDEPPLETSRFLSNRNPKTQRSSGWVVCGSPIQTVGVKVPPIKIKFVSSNGAIGSATAAATCGDNSHIKRKRYNSQSKKNNSKKMNISTDEVNSTQSSCFADKLSKPSKRVRATMEKSFSKKRCKSSKTDPKSEILGDPLSMNAVSAAKQNINKSVQRNSGQTSSGDLNIGGGKEVEPANSNSMFLAGNITESDVNTPERQRHSANCMDIIAGFHNNPLQARVDKVEEVLQRKLGFEVSITKIPLNSVTCNKNESNQEREKQQEICKNKQYELPYRAIVEIPKHSFVLIPQASEKRKTAQDEIIGTDYIYADVGHQLQSKPLSEIIPPNITIHHSKCAFSSSVKDKPSTSTSSIDGNILMVPDNSKEPIVRGLGKTSSPITSVVRPKTPNNNKLPTTPRTRDKPSASTSSINANIDMVPNNIGEPANRGLNQMSLPNTSRVDGEESQVTIIFESLHNKSFLEESATSSKNDGVSQTSQMEYPLDKWNQRSLNSNLVKLIEENIHNCLQNIDALTNLRHQLKETSADCPNDFENPHAVGIHTNASEEKEKTFKKTIEQSRQTLNNDLETLFATQTSCNHDENASALLARTGNMSIQRDLNEFAAQIVTAWHHFSLLQEVCNRALAGKNKHVIYNCKVAFFRILSSLRSRQDYFLKLNGTLQKALTFPVLLERLSQSVRHVKKTGFSESAFKSYYKVVLGLSTDTVREFFAHILGTDACPDLKLMSANTSLGIPNYPLMPSLKSNLASNSVQTDRIDDNLNIAPFVDSISVELDGDKNVYNRLKSLENMISEQTVFPGAKVPPAEPTAHASNPKEQVDPKQINPPGLRNVLQKTLRSVRNIRQMAEENDVNNNSVTVVNAQWSGYGANVAAPRASPVGNVLSQMIARSRPGASFSGDVPHVALSRRGSSASPSDEDNDDSDVVFVGIMAKSSTIADSVLSDGS